MWVSYTKLTGARGLRPEGSAPLLEVRGKPAAGAKDTEFTSKEAGNDERAERAGRASQTRTHKGPQRMWL